MPSPELPTQTQTVGIAGVVWGWGVGGFQQPASQWLCLL